VVNVELCALWLWAGQCRGKDGDYGLQSGSSASASSLCIVVGIELCVLWS
jgi:hypothetical protein